MSGDPVGTAARIVARELATEHGPQIEIDAEAALYARQAESEESARYIDPVSLGSLIVSIASLAYTVYNNHKNRKEKPTAERVALELRVEQRKHRKLTGPEEKIIEIISAEVIKATDGE